MSYELFQILECDPCLEAGRQQCPGPCTDWCSRPGGTGMRRLNCIHCFTFLLQQVASLAELLGDERKNYPALLPELRLNTQCSWRAHSAVFTPHGPCDSARGRLLGLIWKALVLAMKASGTLLAQTGRPGEPLHYPQPIGSCVASPCPCCTWQGHS